MALISSGQSITATDQATGVFQRLAGLIQTDVPLQPGALRVSEGAT